ncbi:neuropeptide-like protein 31 [Odontomachus brunneus]|uniref:neuropeptide-like protein 31 n=1 Tax=Odontomachus brunneus TaxID=486640 RepID=UPI0013F28EC5|nr:neuropeptide-like protein 31 [Odontomachus brunneus]
MKYCVAILLLALVAIAMAQKPSEKETAPDSTDRSKRGAVVYGGYGGYGGYPYSYGGYPIHGYPYHGYPYAYHGYHGYPYYRYPYYGTY